MWHVFAQGPSLDAIKNPLPKAAADNAAYSRAVNQIFFMAAIIAVLMIVVGGIRYAASQGSPDQVKEAKDTIIYSIVGLVVILFSYVIVRFAIGRLV